MMFKYKIISHSGFSPLQAYHSVLVIDGSLLVIFWNVFLHRKVRFSSITKKSHLNKADNMVKSNLGLKEVGIFQVFRRHMHSN